MLLIVGCGGEKASVDTATTEVTVKGTVRLQGKPLDKGTVTFNPSNYARKVAPRQAGIGKDGTYSVTTLVGRNEVLVDSPQIRKDPRLAYKRFTFTVQDGASPFDIDVKPDAP